MLQSMSKPSQTNQAFRAPRALTVGERAGAHGVGSVQVGDELVVCGGREGHARMRQRHHTGRVPDLRRRKGASFCPKSQLLQLTRGACTEIGKTALLSLKLQREKDSYKAPSGF